MPRQPRKLSPEWIIMMETVVKIQENLHILIQSLPLLVGQLMPIFTYT